MQEQNFLLYTSQNGEVKISVRIENETLWLTQKMMSELFGVWVPAISKHLDNIFSEWEISQEATVSKMEIVQNEWERNISREINFYN